MTKQSIHYGIVGFLVGGAVGLMMAQVSRPPDKSADLHAQHASADSPGMTMDDMTAQLQGKTGDQFDHRFLDQMIIHHQGAIDMANLAKQNAGHPEIKQLADSILTTQTEEINTMRRWQKDWSRHSH